MEAYLDNGATTRPFESVKEIMMKALMEDYGNPSSLHKKGLEAEHYIKEGRKIIANTLKAEEKEIIFTSGGTEANNMALIGAAFANIRKGKHIITTKIEHPSVHNPLIFLEENGFSVTYLDVDRNGHIDFSALLEAVRDDTILVSVMHVNNETGSLQDIAEIGKMIKAKNEAVLFHVDAIQSYGKFRIYPKRMGIDLLSASGHKIHGPKGVGFLYRKDKVRLKPLIYGGEQQNGMRSGTENVPGIAGLYRAAEEMYTSHEEKVKNLYALKAYFIDEVRKIDGTHVNAMDGLAIEETAPHIISVNFEDIRSEVLLHALADRGICVSAGSACASSHPKLSGTLKAIGLKKERLEGTLRFSLSVETKKEELAFALEALRELLPQLRRFVRH